MEESGDFSTVLIGDMTAAMRRLKDDHHPRESRTCVRTAFAAVEGHLATLCNELLAKAAGGLTETERMALREEAYRVDATGNIRPFAPRGGIVTNELIDKLREDDVY